MTHPIFTLPRRRVLGGIALLALWAALLAGFVAATARPPETAAIPEISTKVLAFERHSR